MANMDKNGNWIDSRGRLCPPDTIPSSDKERDFLVEDLLARAEKLSEKLAEFKLYSADRIQKFLDKSAKAWRMKEKANWKGNISFRNFNETKQVQRSMQDKVVFDEKLQLAKTLVLEYLQNECKKSQNNNLAKIVSSAFDVDRKGKINTQNIIRLTKIEIGDPAWVKAMTILKESVSVESTRMYIRFSKILKNADGAETVKSINLDFSNSEA